MKKLTKTFVASSIILGTALGVSVSADNVSSHKAHVLHLNIGINIMVIPLLVAILY